MRRPAHGGRGRTRSTWTRPAPRSGRASPRPGCRRHDGRPRSRGTSRTRRPRWSSVEECIDAGRSGGWLTGAFRDRAAGGTFALRPRRRSSRMAVMMILDWHGVSIEDYERVNDEIGIRGDDDAPEGLISHVAAVDEDGEMVIADVWESDEALATFIETKLGPALQKLSLPESEPRIMPVHNRLRGSADEADALILIELEDTS